MYRLLLACAAALVLTACGTQGPAAPPFTEETGIDLLWKYDAPHIQPEEKLQLVTGREKQWYELYLVDIKAGRKPTHPKDWIANGAVVQLDKLTRQEAFMKVQYPSRQRGGEMVVVLFRFVPENGAWKIENHQLPDGTWWKP